MGEPAEFPTIRATRTPQSLYRTRKFGIMTEEHNSLPSDLRSHFRRPSKTSWTAIATVVIP